MSSRPLTVYSPTSPPSCRAVPAPRVQGWLQLSTLLSVLGTCHTLFREQPSCSSPSSSLLLIFQDTTPVTPGHKASRKSLQTREVSLVCVPRASFANIHLSTSWLQFQFAFCLFPTSSVNLLTARMHRARCAVGTPQSRPHGMGSQLTEVYTGQGPSPQPPRAASSTLGKRPYLCDHLLSSACTFWQVWSPFS